MKLTDLFIYKDEATEVVQAIGRLMKETNLTNVLFGQPLELRIDASLTVDCMFDDSGKILTARNPRELFHGITRYISMHHVSTVPKPTNTTAAIKERCVMIDIGRKMYSLNELKQLIRSMAWFQFTHLQLHLSENEGFRIESDIFPEVVSTEYLKKQEIKTLIDYAKGYYIDIIPDLDSPGHLQQVLKHHPEWQLPMGAEGKDIHALHILNPEAVSFMKSLYKEYAELFCDSDYFHIGGDEFINFDELENYPILVETAKEKYGERASGIEVFIEYVNEMIAYVNGLGFTTRVWNDGFYRLNREEQLSLSKECQISYWTRWNPNMAAVSFFFEQGYQVINHNDNFFYYVLGEAAGYTYPTFEKIQDSFQLTTFAHNQVVGAEWLDQTPTVALSIWADLPEAKTGQAVLQDVFWLLAAISHKVYDLKVPKEIYDALFAAWIKE